MRERQVAEFEARLVCKASGSVCVCVSTKGKLIMVIIFRVYIVGSF